MGDRRSRDGGEIGPRRARGQDGSGRWWWFEGEMGDQHPSKNQQKHRGARTAHRGVTSNGVFVVLERRTCARTLGEVEIGAAASALAIRESVGSHWAVSNKRSKLKAAGLSKRTSDEPRRVLLRRGLDGRLFVQRSKAGIKLASAGNAVSGPIRPLSDALTSPTRPYPAPADFLMIASFLPPGRPLVFYAHFSLHSSTLSALNSLGAGSHAHGARHLHYPAPRAAVRESEARATTSGERLWRLRSSRRVICVVFLRMLNLARLYPTCRYGADQTEGDEDGGGAPACCARADVCRASMRRASMLLRGSAFEAVHRALRLYASAARVHFARLRLSMAVELARVWAVKSRAAFVEVLIRVHLSLCGAAIRPPPRSAPQLRTESGSMGVGGAGLAAVVESQRSLPHMHGETQGTHAVRAGRRALTALPPQLRYRGQTPNTALDARLVAVCVFADETAVERRPCGRWRRAGAEYIRAGGGAANTCAGSIDRRILERVLMYPRVELLVRFSGGLRVNSQALTEDAPNRVLAPLRTAYEPQFTQQPSRGSLRMPDQSPVSVTKTVLPTGCFATY
ncbi:hypothetical protein FB451DRAFT_1170437 [Mycena latifolia]|nr:hypothetical protein FB451DRAFT_1170437 [Mycena latifolia]